jgi:hypothetical protein
VIQLETDHWLFGALGVLFVGGTVLVIAASRPSHDAVVAPDGRAAVLVTCSSPGDCITESAEACPNGYRVLSADAVRGTATTITNVSTGNGNSVGFPSTHNTYSGATLIRCGAGQ